MTATDDIEARASHLRGLLGKAGGPAERCPNPYCRALVYDPLGVTTSGLGAVCPHPPPEERTFSAGQVSVRFDRRCPYKPIRPAPTSVRS